jgi:hypothetical protein
VRDALSVGIIAGAFLSRRVVWRGRTYTADGNGMRPLA